VFHGRSHTASGVDQRAAWRTEREFGVGKRFASRTQLRRAAVLAAALATASGFAVYASAAGAGAAPKPTMAQVQSQINTLQGKVDKIGQQYDAAGEQLATAKARLAQVTQQADRAQTQYNQSSAMLTTIAVTQYENSGQSSIVGLLTSGNPDAVLSQASLLLQVEGTHNAEATQFLNLARELSSMKQQRQRTASGVAQLQSQYASQKASITKLLTTQKTLLSSLTQEQQAQVTAATVGGSGATPPGGSSTGTTTTTPPPTYTGPTTSQADKAVAYAYAQIGKPYVWGASGPDSFDCSGLVSSAWAAAGVTIPRVTYDQWSALPHIPMSDLQPGDLILYEGESHVSIYVGNGYIIDAPHTGAVVEKIPESTDWYAAGADGAVRP
jgi:cell wall-associated NlpC family hydrolase